MPKTEPFEIFPFRYEAWFERNKAAYSCELAAVKRLLPEGEKGLEVGVGSGRFAAPLGIGWGVEPAAEMTRLARAEGIRVARGVAEDLPFDDGTFDFVLMVTTVCFLDDLSASFREAARVIRPGGHLVVGFVDKESPLGRRYHREKEKSVFYGIARFLGVDEIVEEMRRAGFGRFAFAQTLFHDPGKITDPDPVREGYGEGSFVVVRGKKDQGTPAGGSA